MGAKAFTLARSEEPGRLRAEGDSRLRGQPMRRSAWTRLRGAESGFEEFAKCSDRAGRRKALIITSGSLLLYDKDEGAEEKMGKFRASPCPSAEIVHPLPFPRCRPSG